MYGRDVKTVSPEYLIPKHAEGNFNGGIVVSAEVALSRDDKLGVVDHVRKTLDFDLDITSIPDHFTITKTHHMKASRHERTQTIWKIHFRGKAKGERKHKDAPTNIWECATDWMQERLPVIRYFPTFLFEFPEKITLNEREDETINHIYRKMFEDVLQYSDKSLDLQAHIVNRVQSKQPGLPFLAALQAYYDSVDRRHVEAVISKIGSVVTAVVIKRWNEVFRDKIGSKEIIVEPSFTKAASSEEVSVGVQFFIKDGIERYNVSERSLGFRWFFCFLLFTQFQAARADGRSTIFIFDEPASNLHARAQRQLLESFVHIAHGDNALIYSTHSHHMINPTWLESTYIAENEAVTYGGSDYLASWENTKTQINVYPYRQFVSKFPDKTTYFQPILEALDYAPSDLEFVEPAVLVEGKSDFYVFAYFSRVLALSGLRFMPSSGADDLGPLIALYLGWGKKFILLLDGDPKGKSSRAKYVDDFGLQGEIAMTTADIAGGFRNLEALLGDEVNKQIADYFGVSGRASKKQVQRYFQEHLATKKSVPIPSDTIANITALFADIERRLESAGG